RPRPGIQRLAMDGRGRDAGAHRALQALDVCRRGRRVPRFGEVILPDRGPPGPLMDSSENTLNSTANRQPTEPALLSLDSVRRTPLSAPGAPRSACTGQSNPDARTVRTGPADCWPFSR